jgi:hypothetical protein
MAPNRLGRLSVVRTSRSPYLLVALAVVALALPSAAAASHHRSRLPVILTMHCKKTCPGARLVKAGSVVSLKGHRLVRGLTVVFPSATGHTTSAPLRLSATGPVFTVPPTAASGLVHVKDASGHRSNAVGPLVVKQAVTTTPPETAIGPPGPSPFDGNGMWIWQLPKSSGGNVASIIALAQAHDITTLYVKSSDGPTNFWTQFTPALVDALHAAGLQVCAWQYVYGSKPAGEAALGAQAVSDGADCLVIDAEVEYEGRYAAAQTYMTDLRAAVGPDYPIGLAGFPYVDFHPAFPYSVFLGPGGAQYNAPQMYWKDIGTSVDTVFSHTYANNAIYQRPIYPLGQTFQGPPASQVTRFRQLAAAYGATGVSWWDWQETPSALWTPVGATLQPLTGFTPNTTMVALKSGAKGDEVVWLQEHLKTGDPGLKVDGEFGSTTTTAVKAFQTTSGLPATGVMDNPTWQALLAVAPTMTNWATQTATAARAPASAGMRGRVEITPTSVLARRFNDG